jgi:hypothetical protein
MAAAQIWKQLPAGKKNEDQAVKDVHTNWFWQLKVSP